MRGTVKEGGQSVCSIRYVLDTTKNTPLCRNIHSIDHMKQPAIALATSTYRTSIFHHREVQICSKLTLFLTYMLTGLKGPVSKYWYVKSFWPIRWRGVSHGSQHVVTYVKYVNNYKHVSIYPHVKFFIALAVRWFASTAPMPAAAICLVTLQSR